MAFEQLESVWPIHGSVLVREDEVWLTAGRSNFLDGGLRLIRLDSTSGQLISETVIDHRDPDYRHGEGNSDSHVKSSLFGASETVIIDGGELVLGTWQSIYFAEFDGPRSRNVYLKIIPA